MDQAHQKLTRLRDLLAQTGGVLIAYSGGVDSTLLLKVAQGVSGERVLAVTAQSQTYPSEEVKSAVEMAQQLGVRHRLTETEELHDPDFAANRPNRCYHCKKELFSRLLEVAREEGLGVVADGANYDDLSEHRPGGQAAKELRVRSPLQEVGLTKQEIRDLSQEMGLPTWNKPSLACLASRIPYGTPITQSDLTQIGAAEQFLHSLGIGQVRVRHHGNLARIEVGPEDLAKFADPNLRQKIVEKLKSLGYTYITLDLQGYRPGAMDEVLSHPKK